MTKKLRKMRAFPWRPTWSLTPLISTMNHWHREVRMKLARGSDVSDLDESWWQYSLITKVCDTAGKVDITPSTFGNL